MLVLKKLSIIGDANTSRDMRGEFTLEVSFGVGEGGIRLLGILAIRLKDWGGGIERGSIARTYCATPGVSLYILKLINLFIKIIDFLLLVISCCFKTVATVYQSLDSHVEKMDLPYSLWGLEDKLFTNSITFLSNTKLEKAKQRL